MILRFFSLTILSVLFSSHAFAQNTTNDFCDRVNLKRQTCQLIKVDCTPIIQSADPALVEQIKQCATKTPKPTLSSEKDLGDLGYLPCCILSPSSRK